MDDVDKPSFDFVRCAAAPSAQDEQGGMGFTPRLLFYSIILSGTSFDCGSHFRYARVRSSAQDDDLETSEVEGGNCITSQRR